jgi:phosphoglycerate dehydrogenase-like enzyme
VAYCSIYVIQLTEASWTEQYREATILCTLKHLPPTLESARNLKFIHFLSAGTDHISDDPIYKNTDIPLTTSSGIHGPMISEWVILQILSAAHKQKMLIEWQNQHVWGNMLKLGPRKDAVGMRFGVLGYGSIGRQG